MEQLKCHSCTNLLTDGDQFCGTCGTPAATVQRPAPWPGTAIGASGESAADQQAPVGQAGSADPFFWHASGRPADRLSNATRYLCAAPYLDPSFAKDVMRELIASHRAVVPSVDIDLGPIIRHCLNARRITLIHDILLTILVVFGLFISPIATIIALIAAYVVGLLPGIRRWRRPWRGRIIYSFITAMQIAFGIFAIVGLLIFETVRTVFEAGLTGASLPSALLTGVLDIAATFLVYLILAGATQLGYVYVINRTLSERLRPETPQIQFARSNDRVESRIAEVEGAQWGNVTLYDGEDPFIGAGSRGKFWSIAIQLDRARPARQDFLAKPASRDYAPIDPVELQRTIRERLLKLKDPGLPPNERVSALTVEDHLVGAGWRRWGSPLIDPSRKTPYSQAGSEAIEAMIRHPQAGLRYYQRISVSDMGPPVMSGARQIIEGVDQGIAISAFVYVAVEGRMFYLEFVPMILPQIHQDYQFIDQLPVVSSGKFLARVVVTSARTLFRDTIRAPAGIYATLRLMRSERRDFHAEAALSAHLVAGDFGARISVRERGAASSLNTYIQWLDAAKYTKIVERLLTETVQDFLAAKGVDTSAFERSASTIVNGIVVTGGTITGGQFQGGHDNVQTPQPAAPQPPGGG